MSYRNGSLFRIGACLAVLGVLSLVPMSLATASAENGGGKGLMPTHLRCEYLVNPLAIDSPAPRLSWIVESMVRAQKQTAYQILVASDEKLLAADNGDLWNSGVVKTAATIHITYAGKPLASRQRCYWKVRVWDAAGAQSAWSETAFWAMGLLRASDWKAQWIGQDIEEKKSEDTTPLEGVEWIWFDEKNDKPMDSPTGSRFFRTAFHVPADVEIKEATIAITADDGFELYMNGQRLLKGSTWETAGIVDIAKMLQTGPNILAVKVTNATQGPAGLAALLKATFNESNNVQLATSPEWKSSKTESENWFAPNFDDSGWSKSLTLGKMGCQPWGEVKTKKGLVLPPPRYLRKEFQATKTIQRATLRASALGIYEVRLNGKRVGDDYFTPGWTDYNKRIYYDTYDVTALVKQGANAIGGILAEGWYAGYVGFSGREHYGKNTRFRAQLELEYTDGTTDLIATDASWKTNTGPLQEADFLMGETYDASRELTGWDHANFDDAAWNKPQITDGINAQIQPFPSQPVRVMQEIVPIKINEPKKNNFVFDMGQNFAGVVRLKVNGHKGDKIVLRFAEMLNPDGTVYTTNLRAARATDTYICKGGGTEIWSPRFTFHGFRYVELTGLDSTPTTETITGLPLSSATPVVGSFECDDIMLNQLYSNICWTQRMNFIDIPTDCPQRDERLGWTGDAQIYIRTAMCNNDVSAFFKKWLVDLNDAQLANGTYPDVAPNGPFKDKGGAAAWADAGIICPWTQYQIYGDKRVLAENYENMGRFIEYCKTNSKDLIRPEAPNYGDWLSIDAPTPKPVLSTAYFANSVHLMAQIAEVLGKKADAERYGKLFEEIKDAFNKEFVKADGRIAGNTQTVYVLALAFDLLPEEKLPMAAKHLVADVERCNWHLSTGFVGTKDLMGVLEKIGRFDVAYRLLHNTTFPSWGFSIENGATSIWERWNGWTPEKGFGDPGMNSFAHYSFGAVGEWMFRNIGGIESDAVAFERIRISPRPDGKIHNARVSYDSIRGHIATEWTIKSGNMNLSVTIPANTTATVRIPVGKKPNVTESGTPTDKAIGVKFIRAEKDAAFYEIGSGTYLFESVGI